MIIKPTVTPEIHKFISGENGAEITELSLVLGLIVAGCIAAIILVGGKMSSLWVSVDSAVP